MRTWNAQTESKHKAPSVEEYILTDHVVPHSRDPNKLMDKKSLKNTIDQRRKKQFFHGDKDNGKQEIMDKSEVKHAIRGKENNKIKQTKGESICS
jgi:hypothetical protein